jgi:uncharacterized membrane protein (Fun14 family)
MSEQTPSLITPLVTQLGVGGIGGLAVGYAVKKIAKIVAFIIGLAFLMLQYLAFKDIISINCGALETWANQVVSNVGAAEGILTTMIANLPFASSFIVGIGIGLKMG